MPPGSTAPVFRAVACRDVLQLVARVRELEAGRRWDGDRVTTLQAALSAQGHDLPYATVEWILAVTLGGDDG